MDVVLNISIIDGPVLIVVDLLGLLGLVYLLVYRPARTAVLSAVVATSVTVALILAVKWYIEDVWRKFPEPIPPEVYAWSGLAVLGIALAVPRLIVVRGIWQRLGTVVAALLVVVAGSGQVNSHFGELPSVRSLVGMSDVETVDLGDPHGRVVPLQAWHRPASLRARGGISTQAIPGTKSGFTAREALVYLPPAYFSDPRPRLPVLVLLAGQPGSPSDWVTSAHLVKTMDDFAAAHDGVSPVVIVADGTGTELGNPLCMDSKLGNAATYLTTDVADWARTHLQVATDRRQWAVGGLSYGGTCALQLVTNYPTMYPTFLNMSGQYEPTLGDRRTTVTQAFGGDEAKFIAVNPVNLMQTRRYDGVAGVFLVGAGDATYRPGVERLYQIAKKSGMQVQFVTVDGGHAFPVWAQGLRQELPWVAARLGIT